MARLSVRTYRPDRSPVSVCNLASVLHSPQVKQNRQAKQIQNVQRSDNRPRARFRRPTRSTMFGLFSILLFFFVL